MEKCLAFFTLLLLMLVDCSQVTGGGDDVTTGTAVGYLYYSDGKAAPLAHVKAIAANSAPNFAPVRYFSETDLNGRYVISSIPSGDYNIYSAQGSKCAVLEQVHLQGVVTLSSDTLKEPGRIDGIVRLSGGEDCRTVLIMVLGGDANLITGPYDTSGVFTFDNLAEGQYRIRFMTTYQAYPLVDTVFNVISRERTDAGTIIMEKKP